MRVTLTYDEIVTLIDYLDQHLGEEHGRGAERNSERIAYLDLLLGKLKQVRQDMREVHHEEALVRLTVEGRGEEGCGGKR